MTPSTRRYRVSHVFLDVDGTLVNYGDAIRAAFRASASTASSLAGEEITPGAVDRARRSVVLDPAWVQRPVSDQRREAVRRLMVPYGADAPDQVQAIVDAYEEARDRALDVFPDVREALEALAGLGLTLIAASNGSVDLDRVGIGQHISGTHYAGDLGVSKPAPRFFALALERFGVEAASALVVGDRLDNDVEPARAAGMHGVLIDRSEQTYDESVHRIHALTELPNLIEVD